MACKIFYRYRLINFAEINFVLGPCHARSVPIFLVVSCHCLPPTGNVGARFLCRRSESVAYSCLHRKQTLSIDVIDIEHNAKSKEVKQYSNMGHHCGRHYSNSPAFCCSPQRTHFFISAIVVIMFSTGKPASAYVVADPVRSLSGPYANFPFTSLQTAMVLGYFAVNASMEKEQGGQCSFLLQGSSRSLHNFAQSDWT